MTTIGLLILIAGLLIAAARRSAGAAAKKIVLIGLLLTVLPYSPWPARFLMGSLQAPFLSRPPTLWSDKNVIVVLGAGLAVPANDRIEASSSSRSRALGAAIAYRDCQLQKHACTIIVSGGDPHDAGVAEAERISALLSQLGITQEDVKIEKASNNTFANARNTAALIRANYPNDAIYLVTSSFHMRRALLYFKHFGVVPTPIISDWVSPAWSLKSAIFNAALTDVAIVEYIGIARYHLYNWLGWNPPPVML